MLMLASVISLVVTQSASGQSLVYNPDRGESFRYRSTNTLTVSQRILERDTNYRVSSDGVVRLTLMDPGARMLWRLGFESLDLNIEGAFPTPRREALRGTVITLSTTPSGVVLEARASGVVPPGIGTRYLERSAQAFFPQLPEGGATVGVSWSDTLTVTEVLRGVTTEIEMVLTYAVADTSALAGRPVIPIDYSGDIVVRGVGTISGSSVALTGRGEITGNYLFDPQDQVFNLHERRQDLKSTLILTGPDNETVEIPSRQLLEARAVRLF
jgi:hypothetical protein